MRYLLTRSTDIDIILNHLNTSQQIHFFALLKKAYVKQPWSVCYKL